MISEKLSTIYRLECSNLVIQILDIRLQAAFLPAYHWYPYNCLVICTRPGLLTMSLFLNFAAYVGVSRSSLMITTSYLSLATFVMVSANC